MTNIEQLEKILKELNKETTQLYKIIEEKNKLIKLQRHYIWELLKEKENGSISRIRKEN